MKKLLAILFVVAYGFYTVSAGESTGGSSSLVFSELTMDKTPGDDGSWVELYNRGEGSVNAEGVVIVCNNRKIFTFPKALIPSKYFVLIKFAKDADGSVQHDPLERVIRCFVKSQANRVKADYRKIDKSPFILEVCSESEKERVPGYCALFDKRIGKDNMMDYVAWGKGYYLKKFSDSIINKKHFQWALDKKIWQKGFSHEFKGIFIGIEGGPGNDPWPKDNAVIARMNFSKNEHINNCWQVVCPHLNEGNPDPVADQKITPGKPNQWFIPSVNVAEDWKNDKAAIVIYENRFTIDHRRFDLAKEEKVFFRVQIAKDPYFEEIIYDKKTELPAAIDKKLLDPAHCYFVRARVEMKKCQTDWSPMASFTYELKDYGGGRGEKKGGAG
jgi:hypothetical protein